MKKKVILANNDSEVTPNRAYRTAVIAKLRPHPLQTRYFSPLTDACLAGLVKDIQMNGLKRQVEILPDGTIFDGHQRIRALKQLGITKVRVIVRLDIANMPPHKQEQEFLSPNTFRRQMLPLEFVRAYLRWQALLYESKRTPDAERTVLSIARYLDCSRRNAQRYYHVLSAPRSVQDAVQAGQLRLNLGAQVGMTVVIHDEVDELLKQLPPGQSPNRAVSNLLNDGKVSKSGWLRGFVIAARRLTADGHSHSAALRTAGQKDVAVLRQLSQMLEDTFQHAEQTSRRQTESVRELMLAG